MSEVCPARLEQAEHHWHTRQKHTWGDPNHGRMTMLQACCFCGAAREIRFVGEAPAGCGPYADKVWVEAPAAEGKQG